MAAASSHGPLVVVSNRLPFTLQRVGKGLEQRPSPGGLVSALTPVLTRHGGTWVGWPGLVLREGEEIPPTDAPFRVDSVPLSEGQVTRYYHGFANRTLWPLFHSMPDRTRFERRDWETYERVNAEFAAATLRHVGGSALTWIHDYQLALVPQQVRLEAPEARLGFFLHIPFPPYDIFRLLPWDREILQGLMACDLIGFHVQGYAWNFLDCVERRLGARVDRGAQLIEYGDRTVRVGAFPIGIEYGNFERLAEQALPGERRPERVVLGADRLDYTKGIPQRIRAFERLLEMHPEHRERTVLLQVAVPSRSQVQEYRDLKREIDELVGHVNGRFATASWSPIRYLYRALDHERLATLYRDADVALVTPLRDGMNLVAKEFVASRVADPGVLVLSSLAGAAETMREALVVNPFDIDRTADALHRALTMDETERASRMASLRRRERRYDVEHWVTTFLDAGRAASERLAPFTDADFEGWLGQYLKRYRLALFLDYDGTLTPLVAHPSDAVLSPEMRSALEVVVERGDADVAMISGRALEDVRKMAGRSDLTYAGNHGLEISGPGIEDFLHEDLVHYRARTEGLAAELEEVAVDGAWTEVKGPTLTFHFRAVPERGRPALIERARELIQAAGYQARNAHAALEARPPIGWDKGRAVLHVLRTRYGPSWSEQVRVIYVGDDQTDEDAFRLLAGLAETFRVGPADTPTAASHRLPDVGAVRALLEWLGRRAPADL
ncbi:MAG: bifunctional alpha,alpha-trehalose-phosphate synthase (UDP-forming)/trehalose-phosphatase [Myxococcota bacterium]|nr:bifunctional alpha,alpha-trehalose-phosphate synthase (UDP-forming)/trehalose-phosphatase [Myxococcota bacterium]